MHTCGIYSRSYSDKSSSNSLYSFRRLQVDRRLKFLQNRCLKFDITVCQILNLFLQNIWIILKGKNPHTFDQRSKIVRQVTKQIQKNLMHKCLVGLRPVIKEFVLMACFLDVALVIWAQVGCQLLTKLFALQMEVLFQETSSLPEIKYDRH